jgi:hypothetical protein
MKVYVYYNLHKHKWSVKCIEPGHNLYGKVISHKDYVILKNVIGKVSEKGRQRVLKEKRKNVHAGIVGTLIDSVNLWDLPNDEKSITYNPYKYKSFVFKENEKPFVKAKYAYMNAELRSVTVYGAFNDKGRSCN